MPTTASTIKASHTSRVRSSLQSIHAHRRSQEKRASRIANGRMMLDFERKKIAKPKITRNTRISFRSFVLLLLCATSAFVAKSQRGGGDHSHQTEELVKEAETQKYDKVQGDDSRQTEELVPAFEAQEYDMFPSDPVRVASLFKGISGCKLSATKSHLKEAYDSAPFLATENELLNASSTKIQRHFIHLPDYDHEAMDWGHVSGGVALFEGVYVQGERPPTFFNCHTVFAPISCKVQEATKESFDIHRLVDSVGSGTMEKRALKRKKHSNLAFDFGGISKRKLRTSRNDNPEVVKLNSAVIIFQFWSEFYFHSTVESLPRLAYVADYLRQAKDPGIVILAPPQLCARSDVLNQILGFDANQKWIVYNPKNTYFVNRLLSPTGTRCGRAQGKCIEGLQASVSNNYGALLSQITSPNDGATSNDTKELIVLQKRQSRRILNHAMLLEAIKEEFASCCIVREFFGTEPLEEVIAMHHAARIIVGPHGAGLANVVFSQRHKAGMVELHPQFGNYGEAEDANRCHQITAKAAGLETRLVLQTDGSRFGDFVADIPSAIRAIQEIKSVLDRKLMTG